MTETRSPHIRYQKAHVSMTIDPDQATQLDEIATSRRTSRAQVIREAVDLYLSENRTHSSSSSSTTTVQPEAA